jgi:hypothetical protein
MWEVCTANATLLESTATLETHVSSEAWGGGGGS